MQVDAIVLAGGRATRMGGIDKPTVTVGGAPMLATALDAVIDCEHRVVVGPHRDDLAAGVIQTQERPPGGGPVAAIAAGLQALPDGEADSLVVILATDLPFLRPGAIRELIRRLAETEGPVVCAVDGDGRPQYLVAAWRRVALAERLAALPEPANLPVTALLPVDRGDLATVAVDGVTDCDTDVDLARAAATLTDQPALLLDAARTALRATLTPLTAHEVPLHEALGGALAAPMLAADAVPRVDSSAMDGYAVAGAGPWQLRADIAVAGGTPLRPLTIGTAARIATGAALPPGANRVVRDEHVTVHGATVTPRPDTPSRDDCRRRGEDWRVGDLVADAGTTVTVPLVSVAASTAVTTATVLGPLRATVYLTGDEISTGETRDSLGPVLPDFLACNGITTIDVRHLADTADAFDAAITADDGAEMLVVVGATGGGAHDQLRSALTRAGARVLVPRLQVRPGGSTVVAELPAGRTLLGLPGNPYAAVAVLSALAPAIVDGRTHRTPQRPRTGRIINASNLSGPVTRILPVRLLHGGDWRGDPAVRTAHLGALLSRDALAVIPPHAIDRTVVEILPVPR